MWQEETESWRIINSMIEAVYLIDEKGKILTCNHGLVALTGYTRNEIVGIYPPYPWQTPLESRKYEQMLRQVAKSRSVNNVGLSWKKKDETRVLTNLTISPLQPFTKKLPRYVVIARDVSQHDHMEELSRAGARIQWLISDLRRKTATLETLIEIHQLLLLNAPLQKIFRQIMIGVRKLVAHDLSGIYLIDEKRKTLSPCVLSTKNAFSRSLVSSSLPLGRGIVGTAAATGRMSLVNNAQMDPRSIYPTRKKPYLEHVIAVPLCLGDMVFGVLAMARNRNPGFIEDEAILVRSLADAATLALEKARSFSQHANNQQEIFGIPIPPSESSGQFMDIFVHGNGNRKRQSRVEKLAQC
jgi:PAS domain S-box-containing protein